MYASKLFCFIHEEMMARVTAVVSHPFNCNAMLLFDIYLSFPEEATNVVYPRKQNG